MGYKFLSDGILHTSHMSNLAIVPFCAETHTSWKRSCRVANGHFVQRFTESLQREFVIWKSKFASLGLWLCTQI